MYLHVVNILTNSSDVLTHALLLRSTTTLHYSDTVTTSVNRISVVSTSTSISSYYTTLYTYACTTECASVCYMYYIIHNTTPRSVSGISYLVM